MNASSSLVAHLVVGVGDEGAARHPPPHGEELGLEALRVGLEDRVLARVQRDGRLGLPEHRPLDAAHIGLQ